MKMYLVVLFRKYTFFHRNGLYLGNRSNPVCQKLFLEITQAIPTLYYLNVSDKSERIEEIFRVIPR